MKKQRTVLLTSLLHDEQGTGLLACVTFCNTDRNRGPNDFTLFAPLSRRESNARKNTIPARHFKYYNWAIKTHQQSSSKMCSSLEDDDGKTQ
jgi:hypothetical protein